MVLAGLATSAVACLTLVGSQQIASAVTCPSGTPRAGSDVSSLAECSISESEDTLPNTLLAIINFALGILGLVAVVFIIMGGVTYITSSGDAAKLTKAKNTILYAVIGLVVSLLAFAIVNFVLNNIFNGEGASDNSGSGSSSSIKTSDECTKAGKTWDGATNSCK